MSKPKKIYILSGGTGGHVFPAKVVAEKFLSEGVEVIWIGTSRGPEQNIAKKLNIKFIKLPLSGFRGKSSFTKLKAFFLFLLSGIYMIFKIWPFKLFSKEQVPMIAFGGYVSLASFFYFKGPVYLQEQNTIPGSVSRLLVSTNKVSKVFCGFKQTMEYFKKINIKDIEIVLSGNPVNENISNLANNFSTDNKNESDSMNILILGGSQGSQRLNELIPLVLNKLGKVSIKHQCGIGNLQDTQLSYDAANIDFSKIEVCEFIDNMDDAYHWSDIVICRSGALSVTEIMASGSIAIFIPLPWSIDNHQFYNAQQLKDKNAGYLIEESITLSDDLIELFKFIRDDQNKGQLKLMKQNALNCFIKDSENTIFEKVVN
jgi:UDP-N-acetylglucosamine--N-acetylmuramyl-(pentapeptide) pyrophosphoryl-undecaprenol N-acetylglucosamine transferase